MAYGPIARLGQSGMVVGSSGRGGFSAWAVVRRWRQKRCRHRVTTTARSMGMERTICDSCGLVAFRYPDSEGPSEPMEVDRDVFARSGDSHDRPPTGPIEDPPPGRHQF